MEATRPDLAAPTAVSPAAPASAASAAPLVDKERLPAPEAAIRATKRPKHTPAEGGAVCMPCHPQGLAEHAAQGATGNSDGEGSSGEDKDELQRPCYIYSDQLLSAASLHPQHPVRPKLVHELLSICGLLDAFEVVAEIEVDKVDLTKFHSRSYVDFLRAPRAQDEEEYGCNYDCPCFPQMWEYVRAIVGGTLAGAQRLVDEDSQTVVHFNGGRHHAKPDRADGFCYINDIVLAIFELLSIGRVMYIDVDCHHGDGVEQAFYRSNRVFTLSMHRFGPGYFPGTGAIDSIGEGKGLGYSCNVPLKAGIRDQAFMDMFRPIAEAARKSFRPAAVVLQCGADALSRDPLGESNLTTAAYVAVVEQALSWGLPLLILGGGGYHNADSARCYAAIAAKVGGIELPQHVPEHNQLHHYGPSFQMATSQSKMEDLNTPDSLRHTLDAVLHNIVRLT